MATGTGRFGMEDRQDERYRLSFTAGALLLEQGRAAASYFLSHAPAQVLREVEGTLQVGGRHRFDPFPGVG